MRRATFTLIVIGAGAMVAAWIAFWAAMTDGNPVAAVLGDTTILFVPAVGIAAGALAAVIDRRPRGLAAVLAGAFGTVLAFTVRLGLISDPNSEWMELAGIGIGYSVVMLTAGFVPVALGELLIHRSRQPA
jgi:hypothetical protein